MLQTHFPGAGAHPGATRHAGAAEVGVTVAHPAGSGGVEGLLRQISEGFAALSPQLRLIARYIERHHDCLAQERIQDVAARCGVQPSAVVRFAKRFGFHGFHDLKQVFRTDHRSSGLEMSRVVQERLRGALDLRHPEVKGSDLAMGFLSEAAEGLQWLQRDVQISVLDDAIQLLTEASCLWIAGSRRSFPVAAYLAYAFQQGAAPVQFLSQLGGMQDSQLRAVQRGDVMIAVSFAPYAEETVACVQLARARGARVIAITDSRMGPLAAEADAVLSVTEPSTLGFRGLTSSMALAQGLFLGYAHAMQIGSPAGACDE